MKLAEGLGMDAPLDRWRVERDRVRTYLENEAAADGWFPQAVGFPVADAATLLVPALGLLPPNHPVVEATIDVVLRDLAHDGLIHRYKAEDGLAGGEGAFLLCSFWLLDCLTHAGRLDEADALMERLLGLANDVGLYSEEFDPISGEALGNFPQAFTHMALVASCTHLAAAKRGLLPPPDEAHDFAELALERLMAGVGISRPHTRLIPTVDLQQALHLDDVEPAAELATDLAFDADDLEAARLVHVDRRLVAPDDAGDHGVEAVRRRHGDELGQDHLAHAAPAVFLVHKHGVLDGRRVRRSLLERADRPEPANRTVFGHRDERGMGTVVGTEPLDLVLEAPRNHVEGAGRLGDLTVVDRPDCLGVIPGSPAHRSNVYHRRLQSRPLSSVGRAQPW